MLMRQEGTHEESIRESTPQHLDHYGSSTIQEVLGRASEQFPFLAQEIYESVVITDLNLPDNPIVYCNDFFQCMTLYPREEILGKNCRFLQGKHTSKASTERIRKAIGEGKTLDVQLLNYRKDGTPFWNNFLLLPIRKGDKVTHLLAIQKDVTFLKQGTKDPQEWRPKEVALYVSRGGEASRSTSSLSGRQESKDSKERLLGPQVVDLIVEKGIDGTLFLSAKKRDWRRWGVKDKATVSCLMRLAKQLAKDDRQVMLRQLLDEGKGEDEAHADLLLQLSSALARKEEGEGVDVLLTPRQLQFWNLKPVVTMTTIKFYYEERVDVSNHSKSVTYGQLLNRVHELYPSLSTDSVVIGMEDLSARKRGIIPIRDDEEFQNMKKAREGRTLRVFVSAGH